MHNSPLDYTLYSRDAYELDGFSDAHVWPPIPRFHYLWSSEQNPDTELTFFFKIPLSPQWVAHPGTQDSISTDLGPQTPRSSERESHLDT